MAACSAPPPPPPPPPGKEDPGLGGGPPDFPDDDDEDPTECLMDLRPCGKKKKDGTMVGCGYVSYMRKTFCLNVRCITAAQTWSVIRYMAAIGVDKW